MTPAEKRRATILARELRDTAYHEAGHAVGYWVHGYRFSSLHVWDDDGNRTGRTQGDAASLWSLRDGLTEGYHLWSLMADMVDERRGVRRSGAHVLDVWHSEGHKEAGRLIDTARALVDQHWAAIEELAEHVIAAPGNDAYAHDAEGIRLRHGFVLGPAAAELDRQWQALTESQPT